MKLMTETIDSQELQFLTEKNEENGEKIYRIKGPFLQADVKNANGRVYSLPLLQREVKKYNDEKIIKKRSTGQLNHPQSPSTDLEKVSHLIESLEMVGNTGMGVARILDTPMGNIVKSLLNAGVNLAVSTRGVGSLNGKNVNDDYMLLGVDVVETASAPDCYVEGILENREYIIQNDIIVEQAVEELEKTLSDKGSKAIYAGMQVFLRDVKKNFRNGR